jgi:hypothetical protein
MNAVRKPYAVNGVVLALQESCHPECLSWNFDTPEGPLHVPQTIA